MAINMHESKAQIQARGAEKRNTEFNVLQSGTYRVHTQNKVYTVYTGIA